MVHTSLSLASEISRLFVFQNWTIFNVTLVMMCAGLTDQIRSLPQVTSHVTVEMEVDTNLPPRSSRAKQTYNGSMLGWAQDTQQSTLIPRMMKSSSVSVNTLAHYSCSCQGSPHQTPMVSTAHKCACLSTNCGRKESAHCQASRRSSSEKFKSFHYRVVIWISASLFPQLVKIIRRGW